MLKHSVFIAGMLVLATLGGCYSAPQTQLQTQAQGEVSLKADQYSIQIGFTAQAQSSDTALAELEMALVGFLEWKDTAGFDVVTQNESVQPIYHYPSNGPRKLSGYQAHHSYIVKGMSLEQYAQAMKALAQFKPESLYQGEVGVSEQERKHALAQAYEMAYAANQAKLSTLMNLANLCEPKVETIKEYTQSHGAPRAMMMEAKSSAPVASEHTVNVRLDMTWLASEC